jgi:hypothetical protein
VAAHEGGEIAEVEHVYERMVQAQRAFTVDPDDPISSMRDLVAHCWNHYVENPELVRLLVTENLHNGKHVRKSTRIRSLSMPLIDATARVVASGQAKGLFRADVDAQDVLLTIMALGFFYVANRHTLSTWLGVDLMEAGRRARWGEHIERVVLDFLTTRPRAARQRSP